MESSSRRLSRIEGQRGLRRVLTWMAGGVALTVAFAVPALYFLTAYYYERARIDTEAKLIAQEISEYIYIHSDLWQFSDHRLRELLQYDVKNSDVYRSQLFGKDGETLAEDGNPQRAPTLVGVADVTNGQDTVATARLERSLWPVLIATAWAALFGGALAVTVFSVLRALPMRALDKALARLEETQAHLHARVAELETAKLALERKGDELEQMTRELAVAKDASDLANRAKTEFLANMSHELRTPLNAVIGFAEIIRDEMLGPVGDPKYRDYAKDINDSGQHLLAIINDILDLSKIEAGTVELHEEEVEVSAVIRSCITLMAERARRSDVELDADLPGPPQPALYADERILKQILVNLLSNAVKFTPHGGRVTVTARHGADGGHVLQVVDTGIGIAPANIPKALARFGQVDGQLARKYDGTGLGLPLTKSLVELHGGALELESELGGGTTVTLRFPPERSARRSVAPLRHANRAPAA